MITTNFELFDNLFQAAVMGICAILAGVLAWKKRRPEYLLLSFGYLCWMLGTLYFFLYLEIFGSTPCVFFVAEMSWAAAYVFLLSVSIQRCDAAGIKRCPLWVYPAALPVMALPVTFAILNGSALMALLFGGAVAALCVISLWRIVARAGRKTGILMLVIILLQGAVYITSSFTSDYTQFNAYFAADLLLTLSLAAVLPMLYREVEAS